MAKVLVVGEALVDIVQRADGSGADHPGGSPANVALGLARLGRDASLLTRIGTDAHGRAIREHLEASGVRLVDGTVVDAPTSTATACLLIGTRWRVHIGCWASQDARPTGLRTSWEKIAYWSRPPSLAW